ncbi:MAG TPA: neutral/alkaline non-lysosomal ceramidase N-terminal domain-containing protein [Candidatus Dormibacteraeota bacterium]|nr:neutral/alkaline non-lysosomal ceramidase N-terminal domain-containing protein [Candidatus Dormibacteraeota bacterium]
MCLLRNIAFVIAGIIQLLPNQAAAAIPGPLKAGAGRVDITPDANAIPRPYTSILDHLYARAIYLENGHDRAVLLNADVGALSTAITDKVSAEISSELNVPAANILISATHDHSAIFGGPRPPAGGAPGEDNAPAKAFEQNLVSGLEKAAKQAHDSMQPARIGFGSGNLYLNVNRDAIDEQTRLWAQEPNLEYPSDKTLAVVKIESLSGQLIAVYMNYAMHANSLFLNGMVSGDFPGEAQRYLERTYDKSVALWTSGAAGDQNPLYWRANHVVEQARIHAVMEAEHVDLGTAIMHAMFVGNPAADKVAVDPVAMDQSIQLVKAMGLLTAEEAIRLISHISTMSSEVKIEGAQQDVTCPGRRRLDTGREGEPGKYEDSPDPVRIKIGALQIGDIALGSANAELYSIIGQHIKTGSKFRETVVVTLTNGMANSGYVPTDDAFGRYTFQVLGSALKPGCAEAGIVNGIDEMIGRME